MPIEARLTPRSGGNGPERFEREYLDLIGRKMRGSVDVTGGESSTNSGTVVAGAKVTIPLVDGKISLDLPKGEYTLTANLMTADSQGVRLTETVKVGMPDATEGE
jgi:hypothetical protein